MPRYLRNSAILAKIETAYGLDAAPSGAANAILVSNLTINPLNAQNVDRALIRGFMGGAEQLVGNSFVDISFDVELAGSGVAGTAPAYGALLRAAGMAEVVSVGSRVEYMPISAGFESATIYYYDDGVLHKLLGVRGTFSLDMTQGNRPMMKYKFTGLDGGLGTAVTPALTLTGFKAPLVITDPNTADVLLGCTYAAGALSAGTAYPSQGLTLDLGNTVHYTPLLGGQSVDITDRVTVGTISTELTAAQEVAMMASVKNNTLQSIGLVHGTAAGAKVMVFAPAVQMINPKKGNLNGRRLNDYDLRFTPMSGNDELRIVVL